MPRQFTPNDARVTKNVAYIALTGRSGEPVGEAIIDLPDLPRVLTLARWHIRYADDVHLTDYVASHVAGKAVLLHRLVIDAPEEFQVDHRNHNGLDCRRKNLRLCTPAENMQNMRGPTARNQSGVLNVYWNAQRGYWGVSIRREGRRIYLGGYRSLDEASEAARRGREELSPFLKT